MEGLLKTIEEMENRSGPAKSSSTQGNSSDVEGGDGLFPHAASERMDALLHLLKDIDKELDTRKAEKLFFEDHETEQKGPAKQGKEHAKRSVPEDIQESNPVKKHKTTTAWTSGGTQASKQHMEGKASPIMVLNSALHTTRMSIRQKVINIMKIALA